MSFSFRGCLKIELVAIEVSMRKPSGQILILSFNHQQLDQRPLHSEQIIQITLEPIGDLSASTQFVVLHGCSESVLLPPAR